MGLVGGSLGYHLLRWIRPGTSDSEAGEEPYASSREKLEIHFGERIFAQVEGRRVADFGSGLGGDVVEFARSGASAVVGIEIQHRFRDQAEERFLAAGVSDRCSVAATTSERVDLVTSIDSFEHFDDPAAALEQMASLLDVGGEVWISFGWPWYHPFGGHLFSVFPWAHLVFTEAALCRWRAEFKSDGATRFAEVDGGLNQMSIRRFERIIAASSLEQVELRLTPIRALRAIHCRATREFSSALVFARLRKRPS